MRWPTTKKKSYISNSHTHTKKKVFSGFASFFTFFFLSLSHFWRSTHHVLLVAPGSIKKRHIGKKKKTTASWTHNHTCMHASLTWNRIKVLHSSKWRNVLFCVFFFLLEMRYWRHARSTITRNFCAGMRVNKSVYDSACHCYCCYSLPLLFFFSVCVCALYCRSPNIVASVQNSKKHEKRRVKKKKVDRRKQEPKKKKKRSPG